MVHVNTWTLQSTLENGTSPYKHVCTHCPRYFGGSRNVCIAGNLLSAKFCLVLGVESKVDLNRTDLHGMNLRVLCRRHVAVLKSSE